MGRLATLRNFAGDSGVDLSSGLHKVATDLSRASLSGKVAVIVTDAQPRILLLHLDTPRVEEVPASNRSVATTPDFVVYARHETLSAILSGELSPLEALLCGRLRYAGNEEFGLRILRQLALSQDAVFELCRDAELPPCQPTDL
jgi:putative sterol carrier protein